MILSVKAETVMETPRFLYVNEYADFEDEIMKLPHRAEHFVRGDYLWKPGEFVNRSYYIQNGIAKMICLHEDGHQRTLDFHGTGDITPGFHSTQFKIEKSICIIAVTEMDTLCFSSRDLNRLAHDNNAFANRLIEVYAKYINELIYQSCHQEFNHLRLKLCNLLLIFSDYFPDHEIHLSQEEIADILAVNRVNIAKAMSSLAEEGILTSSRVRIRILDPDRLKALCSEETR